MAWLAFLGGLIVALLVVLIVVLIADDGAGGTATTAASPATTTATVTTASSPATTATTAAAGTTAAPATTAAATTSAVVTTEAPPECAELPADSIPPSATDLTSVIGDLNGDGNPDAVTVFQDGGLWFVFVELDYGYATRASVPPFHEFSTPQAKSVMDVGSAAEVALVETGFSLVGPVFGVWHLDGCDLQRATRDGVAPFEPFGGMGPVHSEGFSCTLDGLKLVNAAQPGGDPDVWRVEEISLLWVPGLSDFQTQGTETYETDRVSALAVAADTGC